MTDELLDNRIRFEKSKDRNVFVIMRFGKHGMYKVLEKTIKDTVHLYGFQAILARDVSFHADLWRNIEFCMTHSRYAIVVFERTLQPDFRNTRDGAQQFEGEFAAKRRTHLRHFAHRR